MPDFQSLSITQGHNKSTTNQKLLKSGSLDNFLTKLSSYTSTRGIKT